MTNLEFCSVRDRDRDSSSRIIIQLGTASGDARIEDRAGNERRFSQISLLTTREGLPMVESAFTFETLS